MYKPSRRDHSRSMIHPDEWARLVHNELADQGLVAWITPVNPTSESYEAREGVMPLVPRTHPDFKDWFRPYCKVSAAMTRNLGKDMMSIVGQQEYVALYSFCPALQRYRTIRSILRREAILNPQPSSSFLTFNTAPSVRHLPVSCNPAAHASTQAQSDPDVQYIPHLSTPGSNRIVLRPHRERARICLAQEMVFTDPVVVPPRNVTLPRRITPPMPSSSPISVPDSSSASSSDPDYNPIHASSPDTSIEPDSDEDADVSPVLSRSGEAKRKAALKSLMTERLVDDKWGQRCSRCGRMAVKGVIHKVNPCTATHLSATSKIPIMTKHAKGVIGALVVVGGPANRRGEHICRRWQFNRTLDGLCYLPNCAFTHACSLCLCPDHRAVDCDAYRYLPFVSTPRPSHLPPRNVDQCYRQYHGLTAEANPRPSSPTPTPPASGSRMSPSLLF